MGVDCGIYAFPKDRAPRECWLDRMYCFDGVIGRYGDHKHPIPAIEALACIESAPEPESYYNKEYVAHWRKVAADFCRKVIRRWGEDVPVMVYDENTYPDLREHPAHKRLARMKEARREREKAAKLTVEIERNKVVYDWLEEKKRRQYSDDPELSLVDFMKGRALTPPSDPSSSPVQAPPESSGG